VWPFRRKRGRVLFRSYELAVIDALGAALPPEAAERYARQIESIELVQRHFEDTDVNTYPRRSGPQYHDPAHAFANRSLELNLATLTLHGSAGMGHVKVIAVDGHVFSYDFKPSPRKLGPRDSIVVTKMTLHVDPTQPDVGSSVARRLDALARSLRAELDRAWSERPGWADALVDRDGIYGIDLEDGSYLVLAQLEDTTYVVAGVDPRRPNLRRYEPSGDLAGEYRTLQEALLATRDG
jgi:hypothetical protein